MGFEGFFRPAFHKDGKYPQELFMEMINLKNWSEAVKQSGNEKLT